MKKRIAAVLVMGILVLTSCNPETTEVTTVMTVASETTPVATTTATTATPTKAPTPKPTKAPTPTPTVVPETTSETTPVETTAAPTKAPTPKPTKAPVETTAATTTATTAAPTDPPPTTTAAPTYTENTEAIRDLIIQYCIDNGKWAPDAEKTGDSSVQWHIPLFFSDADYANRYVERKIASSTLKVKSVSVWIEDNNIYIAHETSNT